MDGIIQMYVFLLALLVSIFNSSTLYPLPSYSQLKLNSLQSGVGEGLSLFSSHVFFPVAIRKNVNNTSYIRAKRPLEWTTNL